MKQWRAEWEKQPQRVLVPGERRGYGGSWTRLARWYRELHPICERCQAAPSEEVHHKVKVALLPSAKLDPANLEALCRRCHEAAELEAEQPMRKPPPA